MALSQLDFQVDAYCDAALRAVIYDTEHRKSHSPTPIFSLDNALTIAAGVIGISLETLIFAGENLHASPFCHRDCHIFAIKWSSGRTEWLSAFLLTLVFG